MLADRLVVTKTDIAGEGAGATLTARLRELNPGAEILEVVNGAIDPTRLTEPAADQRNPFVADVAHADGIGSFVLTESTPMPWPVFARTMDTLMTLRGPDLLRVKGFLDVKDAKGRCWCSSCSTWPIRRLSLNRGPTEIAPAELCSSRAIFRKRRCAGYWRQSMY